MLAVPPSVSAELLEVPIGQADLRDDATVAFLRGYIVRAGGTDGGGRVRGDVVRFDARTGDRSSLPGISAEPFPARARPAIVWDADDRGLALGGGIDANGVAHDDVWLLREREAIARKIVPDSPAATRVPLGPESPPLVLGAEQRAVRFGATGDFSRENGRVPTVVTRRAVVGASHALRIEGGTVYVAEGSTGNRYDATKLLPLGPHDVSEWVRRREAGNLRLRQRFPTALGNVEVAWTKP